MLLHDSLTGMDTASLAANARMSAQETTPGHWASTVAFMSSMASKPFKVRFGIESLSATLLAVEFSRTDASQPCNHAYMHVLQTRYIYYI